MAQAFIAQLPDLATAAASSGLSERAIELNRCFLSFVKGRPPLAALVVGCRQYLEHAIGGSERSPSCLEAACRQFLDIAQGTTPSPWRHVDSDATFNLVLVGGAAVHKSHWIGRHATATGGPIFNETIVSCVKVHRLDFWTNRGSCILNVCDVGDIPCPSWTPSGHRCCPPDTRARVFATLLCHSRPDCGLSLLPRALLTAVLEYLPTHEYRTAMENIHRSWTEFNGAIVMSDCCSSTPATPSSFVPSLCRDVKRHCGEMPTAVVDVRKEADFYHEKKEGMRQSDQFEHFEISTDCCSSKFCVDSCRKPNEAPFLWLIRALTADPKIVFVEEPVYCCMLGSEYIDDATRARYEAELREAARCGLPDENDDDL